MASDSGAAENGGPSSLGDLQPQKVLQLAYGSGDADRPCLIDLRDANLFMASRLRDSYSVPLSVLVPRMFLLPDRATPLGLVVSGPPATQTVNGAATAGGVKTDIQLTAFLESRGWRVAFCVEASAGLWRFAEETGVLEVGGCALSLKRRWPFQPSKLLMQQAGLVEEMLVRSRLYSTAVQQASADVVAGSCLPPARESDGGTCAARGVRPLGATHDDTPDTVTFRMLDVGCGSGRDLASLATRSSIARVPDRRGGEHDPAATADAGTATDVRVTWECVGLDSWYGALQRAAEVLALGEVPAGPGGVTLHLVQIGPGAGELRSLPLPAPAAGKAGQMQLLRRYLAAEQGQKQPQESGGVACETAPECERGATSSATACPAGDGEPKEALDLSALGRFDLLVCVRFLERSFLQSMAELLKPGGVILFSTFVDGPGLRAFGRPQGREHVLERDELAKNFFGPGQGFRVLRDDVEAIPDGREVSMFCACKLT